jgi:hypothetical protein
VSHKGGTFRMGIKSVLGMNLENENIKIVKRLKARRFFRRSIR